MSLHPPRLEPAEPPDDDRAVLDEAMAEIIRHLARRRAWEDHLRDMGNGGQRR